MKTAILALLLATFGAVHAGDLRPVRALQKVNFNALQHIQRTVDAGLHDLVEAAAPNVIVEPTIVEMRFTNGGKRFFFGPLSPPSYVRLRVRIKEGDTAIEQEFYEASGRWKGALSIGASDNDVLKRVADRAVEFVKGRLSRSAATSAPAASPASPAPQPPEPDIPSAAAS